MTETKSLPVWLTQTAVTKSTPSQQPKNRLQKNLNWLNRLVQQLNQPIMVHQTKQAPWIRVLNLLVMVLLLSLSQKPLVIWLLAIIWLVQICQLAPRQIVQFGKRLLKMSLFSWIFILPSCFLGSWSWGLWLMLKTTLILGQVALFLQEMYWADFIFALRQLHLPQLFILALDITIKYCHILANYLRDVLWAINLRTVGTLPHPFYQTAQIIGHLYLTSKQYVSEVYQAMILRGYNAKKATTAHLAVSREDWKFLGLNLGLIAAYCLFWRP